MEKLATPPPTMGMSSERKRRPNSASVVAPGKPPTSVAALLLTQRCSAMSSALCFRIATERARLPTSSDAWVNGTSLV